MCLASVFFSSPSAFIMSGVLDNVVAFLPPSLLGKWQLIVASAAVFNTIQNFLTLKLTRRIYNNVSPASVTALQARTFAVWTLTSAVVRFYAAFHIHEKAIYDMALFTYLIAFGHFSTELFIFKTARINAGVLSPTLQPTNILWIFSRRKLVDASRYSKDYAWLPAITILMHTTIPRSGTN
ncbi:hypothetical protein NP233_g3108 [Leucocoprinus birnbaumii]|uniref:Erg28-like protein n=1 Tax=Leucocoprinus birnbaumii TaxID=56174 RepID=A0AAD5VXR6_9AGAR|nr:hypothetical protein NP233_g3108 [Leucocoprinus birnbaumii]